VEIMLYAFTELETVCWNSLNSAEKIMAEIIRENYGIKHQKA
jgi:hypothetical protein